MWIIEKLRMDSFFLTNDSLYWKEKNVSKVYGEAFSMENGKHSNKEKKWKNADKVEKAIGVKKRIPLLLKTITLNTFLIQKQ